MVNIFSLVKTAVSEIAELLVGLGAVAVLVEVLFGVGPFGVSIIGNMTKIVINLGTSGFAGLISILLILAIVNRK